MRYALPIAAAVLVSFLGIAFFVLNDAPLSVESPETRKVAPPGFKEYRNDSYGFSFIYEEGARIAEFPEEGGAFTVTLEDEARLHALQIFIVPYEGATIREERFRQDLPSGVRKSEEIITIDGITASAFISEVEGLGPTREVWLIRNGYLYEISVPLSLEAWLRERLLSFVFF
jgi:hypothetical protein